MELFIAIIAVIVIAIVIFVISSYNKLVTVRNRVKDQFAQVDVQLKRRYDLIPNLVEAVKGYAAHESDTIEAVIAARKEAVKSNGASAELQANDQLTAALTKLMALKESYPDLKANESFNQLSTQLAETEDKIAMARQFYNDTVLKYNNTVQMFPTNIVAGIFGFKAEKFTSATDTERQNVEVKF